jgi:hypothetical protein
LKLFLDIIGVRGDQRLASWSSSFMYLVFDILTGQVRKKTMITKTFLFLLEAAPVTKTGIYTYIYIYTG